MSVKRDRSTVEANEEGTYRGCADVCRDETLHVFTGHAASVASR